MTEGEDKQTVQVRTHLVAELQSSINGGNAVLNNLSNVDSKVSFLLVRQKGVRKDEQEKTRTQAWER